MATELGTIVADFTTQLATKISVGGTTATLQSATDDDSVALPSGTYYFTIDGDSSQKEHIQCSLSGTSLTSIQTVTRQGTLSSGTARAHRVGAQVTLTNFAYLKKINDLLDGTTEWDSAAQIVYDGTPTITDDDAVATKKYADDLAIAGAADASTSTKGITKMSTAPASPTNPIAVGDNDPRVPTADENDALAGSDGSPSSSNVFVTESDDRVEFSVTQDGSEVYAATSTGNDTYAITLSPVPTAYAAGNSFKFKTDVANTGAATLNVNSLGAKTIKKNIDEDLQTGDIGAGQIIEVTYDGTNFQVTSPISQFGTRVYVNGVSSSTVLTGTLATIDWPSATIDTLSEFNDSTDTFTATSDGTYFVEVSGTAYSSNWGGSGSTEMELRKNGSEYTDSYAQTNSSGISAMGTVLKISCLVELDATDTLTVFARASGTSPSISHYNLVIYRVA